MAGGRILVLEANRRVSLAVGGTLVQLGYSVWSVPTAAAFEQLPQQFDCGIFSDTLPDASPIALAGWLLLERRIQCAVFFGTSKDVEFRLRASNLGGYVDREEGFARLARAVRHALIALEPPASRICCAAIFEGRIPRTSDLRSRRLP